MFERFTDRARRVVVLAQEEARMLNHNYIGTEHILLGLIHEGEGVAAKALESLGISLEGVRHQVEEIIGQGQQAPSGHIPFTPRAKKVLELSLREALQLGHGAGLLIAIEVQPGSKLDGRSVEEAIGPIAGASTVVSSAARRCSCRAVPRYFVRATRRSCWRRRRRARPCRRWRGQRAERATRAARESAA